MQVSPIFDSVWKTIRRFLNGPVGFALATALIVVITSQLVSKPVTAQGSMYALSGKAANSATAATSGTLTLSSSSCSIAAGASSCNVILTWTTTNPVGVSAVTSNYPSANTTVATGNSGSTTTSVPYNSRSFFLYNNGVQLATRTATSSCVSGTTWNGSTCRANMSGTLTPASPSCSITAGASSCNVSLTWTTTNPVSTSSVTSNYPSANTTVFTGNNGTNTASVPHAGRSFFLYNNGVLLATSVATANCASGATWNGSTCQAPMSGTLTPASPSCTIAAGASSCNVSLTWTTTNPVVTSSVTSNYPSANTTVATGNSGSTTASVPYNSRTFYLYNNAQLLATSSATSSCASGTAWNGSTCQAPMSGTLTPVSPSCSIAAGASSCNVSLTWSTTNPISVSSVTSNYPSANTTVFTGNNGSNTASVPHAGRSFFLYNNGVLLATSVATANCASGATWNGSTCQAPMSGTLTPASPSCTIAAGASSCNVSLTWSTTNPVDTSSVTSNYPSANTTVATGNAGGPITVAVPYSSRAFYLYNNAQLLATSSATSSCASGTTWDGSTCRAPMSGTLTLSASSCSIAAGASSCNVNLTWTTTNPVAVSAVTTDYPIQNTVLADSNNGGPLTALVHYSSQTFYLYNNGVELNRSVATSSCALGTTWNGSVCQGGSRISGSVPPPFPFLFNSPVFLQRYPASVGAQINPNLRTWIIIHGRESSSTDLWVSGPGGLAAAISNLYPNDQILLLDWSFAAADPFFQFTAEDWIQPVATWAASKLIDYGFAGSDLNLIGHSWGGSLSAELAERVPFIRSHSVNLVNTIVALDPARNGFPIGGTFDPDDPDADGGLPEIDFARNSRFSWAFHSSDLGSGKTPTTAHEAFGVNTGGIASDAHSWVHDVFIDMLRHTNAVSQRFTLARLLDQSTGSRTLGPWDTDRYKIGFGPDSLVSGYEGTLTTTVDGQTPYSLTYYSKTTGQEVTEYAVGDTTPPSITITSPTSNPTYPTTSGTVTLGGDASDSIGVTLVTWVNDRGGSGTASGTTSWSIGSVSLQSGANVITVTARDAAGNMGTDTITVTYNPLPTISSAPFSRQQGSPASNATIANVSDANQAANTLTVTVIGSTSATVNSVTVSNLSVNAAGVVTANVLATCSATNASFTLTVTDSAGASANATLNVTVTSNTAPTLTYGNQSVAASGSLTINPATGPSDNGTLSSIAVQSQGSYTGTISVNNGTGIISLSGAKPSGQHTITIRATDNCGAPTDTAFTLNVSGPGAAQIEITPSMPTTNDNISVRIFSDWPNGCTPQNPQVTIAGNQIVIATTNPGQVCTQIITPWSHTLPIGKLPAGSKQVIVTYNGTQIGSSSFNVGCATIVINPATITSGTVNSPYSQTFTQSGGGGAITFNLTGALPSGLSFNAATATLSGTPTQTGNFSITVKATDASGCMGTQQYTVTINPPPNQCQETVPPDHWRGEYFNNRFLTVPAAMVRDDGVGALNFSWGQDSPSTDCGLGIDNFSVRWTRTVNFVAGTYRFTVTGDDGVRLIVDGQNVINKWIDQGITTYTAEVLLSAGNHELKLEYYENGGDAVAKLSWQVAPTCQPETVAANRWKGEYFNALRSFSGSPLMVRDDGDGFLDQNFGANSPGCNLGVDGFTVRWTRTVNFAAGTYRFTAAGDDGIRFYVDGVLKIDQWRDQSEMAYSVDVPLSAGNHELKLEYYEGGGLAVARLSWINTGGCNASVPADHWKGEYYNALRSFSGPLLMVRDDGTGFLDQNFGTTSPGCNLGADSFTVRWTRMAGFAAGNYRFTVAGDDGFRFYVDGVLKLDQWYDQSETSSTVEVSLSAGNHELKLEYYENGGLAVARLSWSSPDCVMSVPANHWNGEYYNALRSFTGTPLIVRDDGDGFLNQNFGANSPGCNLGVDGFTVRWTRTVNFTAGTYRFTVTGDDGIRLKIDGQTVLDRWVDQGESVFQVDVPLTAGNHTIVVEYYENGGLAVAKLSWQPLP